MKHTSSSRAIELARRAAQRKSKKVLAHAALDATNWIPNELADGMVYCQYAGCNKHFQLMDGFTSPVPIARMVNEEVHIALYPLLTFCSPKHLLAACLPFGATVSEEGDGYHYTKQ